MIFTWEKKSNPFNIFPYFVFILILFLAIPIFLVEKENFINNNQSYTTAIEKLQQHNNISCKPKTNKKSRTNDVF